MHVNREKLTNLQMKACILMTATMYTLYDSFKILRRGNIYSQKWSPAEQDEKMYDWKLFAIVEPWSNGSIIFKEQLRRFSYNATTRYTCTSKCPRYCPSGGPYGQNSSHHESWLLNVWKASSVQPANHHDILRMRYAIRIKWHCIEQHLRRPPSPNHQVTFYQISRQPQKMTLPRQRY